MSTLPKETDDELREWMADWQADPAPAAEVREAIRRRVRRQSLVMILMAAGELAFACGGLLLLIWFVWRHPQPIDIATMAGFCLLVVWAELCSLWYRRGVWRPSAETTAAYLDLSLRRCQRRLLALRAGWWLLAAEVALFIPWLWVHLDERPASPGDFAFTYGFLALMAGGMAAILVFLDRCTRRELQELEAVRRSLGENP